MNKDPSKRTPEEQFSYAVDAAAIDKNALFALNSTLKNSALDPQEIRDTLDKRQKARADYLEKVSEIFSTAQEMHTSWKEAEGLKDEAVLRPLRRTKNSLRKCLVTAIILIGDTAGDYNAGLAYCTFILEHLQSSFVDKAQGLNKETRIVKHYRDLFQSKLKAPVLEHEHGYDPYWNKDITDTDSRRGRGKHQERDRGKKGRDRRNRDYYAPCL